MEKVDYKKRFPDLYAPKRAPAEIWVPELNFIMVDGRGNPNEAGGEYERALDLLYALCYTIKMSKLGQSVPEGYFEYVVPPLEGLWSMDDGPGVDYSRKEAFCWTAMIRQPEFVTEAVFAWACCQVSEKKQLDISKARLQRWTEGRCVQCMHLGSYDDEPATLKTLHQFAQEHGWTLEYTAQRRHHEIYLSDPRRVPPERLKTVLRLPIQEG